MKDPFDVNAEDESRQSVELGEDIQIACDECGMVGPLDQVRYIREDDDGSIEFLVLEMDECSHGFVVAVKDETVQRLIDKTQTMEKRLRTLGMGRDITGYTRTVGKLKSLQIEVQKHMRILWQERAQHVSDWPATTRLANNDS